MRLKTKISMYSIVPTIESIVNAWIRLSNYYGTRLDEIKTLNFLFGTHTIYTLDFLHTGYKMRDGTDLNPFGGVLPSAVSRENQIVIQILFLYTL